MCCWANLFKIHTKNPQSSGNYTTCVHSPKLTFLDPFDFYHSQSGSCSPIDIETILKLCQNFTHDLFSQVEALENVTTLIGRMNSPNSCYQSNWANLDQEQRCSCLCAIEHGTLARAHGALAPPCGELQSPCFKCAVVCYLINTVLLLFIFSLIFAIHKCSQECGSAVERCKGRCAIATGFILWRTALRDCKLGNTHPLPTTTCRTCWRVCHLTILLLLLIFIESWLTDMCSGMRADRRQKRRQQSSCRCNLHSCLLSGDQFHDNVIMLQKLLSRHNVAVVEAS